MRTSLWCAAVAALALGSWSVVDTQRASVDAIRRQRFIARGDADVEGASGLDAETARPVAGITRPAEAPAAFDDLTNGFDPQGPAFDSLEESNVIPLRSFNDNRFVFEEVETVRDGLGRPITRNRAVNAIRMS